MSYFSSFFRYKDYTEARAPYRYTRQYFVVLAARLGFVILFQYLVFFTVGVVAWLIPDIPHSLNNKIKREEYLARESMTAAHVQKERKTLRDLSNARIEFDAANITEAEPNIETNGFAHIHGYRESIL